jgi:hypothetical protein
MGVRRANLKHDVRAGTKHGSGGVNKVVSLTLYAAPTLHLAPPAAATAQDLEAEMYGVEFDAPICLWWDQPPFEEAQ